MSPLYSETVQLQHPGIKAIPQLGEQLTFLYVSWAKIVQDDTGVIALFNEDDVLHRVSIPTASLASIMLGPGVSVTQPALVTMTRHGTAVLWVGSDGSRAHGWAYSLTSSSRWIEAQAAMWADHASRLSVAVEMYEQRFGGLPPGGEITLQRLRGLEGQRMKQVYSGHSAKHKIKFRRGDYDPAHFEDAAPINQALSSANAALYGVAASAIAALGCHPGLGFVHLGTISAFVYDVADLYKTEISIPAAFAAASHKNPASEARRITRKMMVEGKILKRAVEDIQRMLAPGLRSDGGRGLSLIDDGGGTVEGGINYASSLQGGRK